jgi:hypothetical protein
MRFEASTAVKTCTSTVVCWIMGSLVRGYQHIRRIYSSIFSVPSFQATRAWCRNLGKKVKLSLCLTN